MGRRCPVSLDLLWYARTAWVAKFKKCFVFLESGGGGATRIEGKFFVLIMWLGF